MNIADTPFTINFLVDVLSSSGFNCSIESLCQFKAEDITHGSAFFSRIFRVKFDWNREGINPKTIILKVPGVQKVAENDEREDSAVEYLEFCHSNEIRAYDFLLKESKRQKMDLKIPRVYYGSSYSRSHDKGLIIMDDLSTVGGNLKLLPGLNNAQIEAVVDELAKIHVLSWNNPEMVHNNPDRPDDDLFLEEMKDIAHQLREIQPKIFNPLMDELDELFTYKVMTYGYSKERQFGVPPTMVHSDLWSGNMLFDKNSEGVIGDNLTAIIDWQGIQAGNPCVDLGRLLGVNTTSDYRRKNTKRLLERYIQKVSQLMDGNVPFDLDDLCEAYDASMGFVAMFMGFGVPIYYNMPAIVGSGGNTDALREELIDRTKCFFEDTLQVFRSRKFKV